MPREQRQMYELMQEAVVNKRFIDKWGSLYTAHSADIHNHTIYATYHDKSPSNGIDFYHALGDQPIDDNRLSKLETLPIEDLTEREQLLLGKIRSGKVTLPKLTLSPSVELLSRADIDCILEG